MDKPTVTNKIVLLDLHVALKVDSQMTVKREPLQLQMVAPKTERTNLLAVEEVIDEEVEVDAEEEVHVIPMPHRGNQIRTVVLMLLEEMAKVDHVVKIKTKSAKKATAKIALTKPSPSLR